MPTGTSPTASPGESLETSSVAPPIGWPSAFSRLPVSFSLAPERTWARGASVTFRCPRRPLTVRTPTARRVANRTGRSMVALAPFARRSVVLSLPARSRAWARNSNAPEPNRSSST